MRSGEYENLEIHPISISGRCDRLHHHRHAASRTFGQRRSGRSPTPPPTALPTAQAHELRPAWSNSSSSVPSIRRRSSSWHLPQPAREQHKVPRPAVPTVTRTRDVGVRWCLSLLGRRYWLSRVANLQVALCSAEYEFGISSRSDVRLLVDLHGVPKKMSIKAWRTVNVGQCLTINGRFRGGVGTA